MNKTEMSSERALDEIFFLKEQLKSLQDERKRDVEETADFIKQIINNGKLDQQKEISKILSELERLRKEVFERSSLSDLLDTKNKILNLMSEKVGLKEVQQALNEC